MDAVLAWLHEHIRHVIAALLLLARLADIGTTWLATPTLALEANPVVRKLGWWFAVPTLLIFLVPYVNLPLGIVGLIVSLLVSASNASRLWIIRGMGEAEHLALLQSVARRTRRSHALASVYASAGLTALAGLTMLMFYPDVAEWGFWFGWAIVVYAIAMALHGTAFIVRLFRDAGRGRVAD